MRNFLKKYYKLGMTLVLVLTVGIVGEVLYNLPVPKEDDFLYLTNEQIKGDGFTIIDEICVNNGKGGMLELSFPEQYVDKLYYQADYLGELHPNETHNTLTVDVIGKNGQVTEKTIFDDNNAIWGTSTVNVREVTDKITIEFPDFMEYGTIQKIAINNTMNHSLGRIFFYFIAAALVLMVISIAHGKIKWKPEWIFLMTAATLGCLLVMILPSHKIGLDEEIHFGRAYYLFDTLAGKDEVVMPKKIKDLTTPSLSNWPYNIAQSEEEYKSERAYWNSHLNYDPNVSDTDQKDKGYEFQLYSLSYLPQTIMIKVGQLLRMDFSDIYMLGRLGNLILYCAVVFFAIKHIVVGKRIMLVLALMPTALFSAVTYSYDAFVTAFSFLGIAYLISELIEAEKKISYKNCAIFSVALILASFPKPIYIPMIALALFFPASKFRSKKEKFVFKGIITGAFAIMLATFMLPPLLNPNQAGDDRGGDTGIGRQLRYIFAGPWQYTKLLLYNIGRTFWEFTFGKEGLGKMGHYELIQNKIPIAILLLYTTITDGEGINKQRLKRFHKIVIVGISFAIMCLIWTALYLSFTPVGANEINGVQGRYYIPVSMLLLLAFNIKQIKVFIKENLDYALISAASIGILFFTIYNPIITNSF